MSADTIIDDLFRHNDWANGHILRLSAGLTNDQLDQPREIGFGSLRATIFHILAAEQIWLERWRGEPWRPFPMHPEGMSLEQIAAQLSLVSASRRTFMNDERQAGWQRQVTYLNSERKEGTRRLRDLLFHVANHSIHHRAQALHFLKHLGRTVPVGLDYLVYKFAYPTVDQSPEVIDNMRKYGLEAQIGPGSQAAFNRDDIASYFAYHDWANQELMKAAAALDSSALERDFAMGTGSFRKTLQHVLEVEPYWLKNWAGDSSPKAPSTDMTTIAELQAFAAKYANQRNTFINQMDETKASQTVLMSVGGPPMKFRVTETLLQIVTHATHHRAQLVNMLRQNGVSPPTLDYVFWASKRDSQTL